MKRKIFILLAAVALFVMPLEQEHYIIEKSVNSHVYVNEKVHIQDIKEEVKVENKKIATNENKKTTTIKKATTKSVIVSGIGEKKNGVSQNSLNILNTQLNKLPKNVTARFKEEGWHIYITNENLAKKYFGGKYANVEGLTSYQNEQILIYNKESYIKESAIHEMGHFIDYYYNYISYEEEWKIIYNAEVSTFKKRITNSSCVRDPQEFFAETVYYMYTNPSKCTPKAKAFISNLINNM